MLSKNPPSCIEKLMDVKGIGKKRLNTYGAELMEIINKYKQHKPPKNQEKKNSVELTTELLEKIPETTLENLAALRGLTVSTITEHLSKAAAQGHVDITKFVTKEKYKLIEEYFTAVDDDLLGRAKNVLGEDVSWEELKLVRAHLRHLGLWRKAPG